MECAPTVATGQSNSRPQLPLGFCAPGGLTPTKTGNHPPPPDINVLVGAFSLKEKSPTITVGSFFSSDLIVYVPLFSTDFHRLTVNPAVTGSSPCFSQKLFRAFAKANETEGSPLSIFSAVCDFFSIFFVSKGPPFIFFDILQQSGFSKSPKGPPFTGLKTLRFLSLRYSTDFRRCRLVFSILFCLVHMTSYGPHLVFG